MLSAVGVNSRHKSSEFPSPNLSMNAPSHKSKTASGKHVYFLHDTYIYIFSNFGIPSPFFNAIPTKTPQGDGNRASFEQRQPRWVSGSQDFGCV